MSNPDEPIENEFVIGGNERRAIVLVDYDPSWPVRFQNERAKIRTAIGAEALGIEHIGSTAVPGLTAKPIIDVRVTVADIEAEPCGLNAVMPTVTGVVSVIAVLATLGMTLYPFAATGAAGIADGDKTFLYRLQTCSETIVNLQWSLSIAVLAVAGGLTRIVGNLVTIALGLVGRLAFALASATITFTDRLDPLFPVGGLILAWAFVVGLMALLRKV